MIKFRQRKENSFNIVGNWQMQYSCTLFLLAEKFKLKGQNIECIFFYAKLIKN